MPESGHDTPNLAQATTNLENALQDFKRALRPVAHAGAATPVFSALRVWRTQQARTKGLPPYIIATDAVLRAIEAARPTDLGQLQAVRGISPAKVASYGNEILEVVAKASPA